MADISKIVLPDNSTYNFKDEILRDTISDLVVKSTFFDITRFSKDNISLANYTEDTPRVTTATFSVAQSGYTPLGIASIRLQNASTDGINYTYTQPTTFYLSGNTVTVILNGLATTNGMKVKLNVDVLYRKN